MSSLVSSTPGQSHLIDPIENALEIVVAPTSLETLGMVVFGGGTNKGCAAKTRKKKIERERPSSNFLDNHSKEFGDQCDLPGCVANKKLICYWVS